jgi:hypothetical protein
LLYPECIRKTGSLAYPVPYRGCLLCGSSKLRAGGRLTHLLFVLVGKSLCALDNNFGMAFLVLGQQSGFSDEDLKEQYLDTMNPKLQRIIMGRDCKKDTLNQIIAMAHDTEMNLYEDAKRSNRHYWYNNNPTQATGLDPNAIDISASVLGSKPSFIKKPQNQTRITNSAAQSLAAATQNNQQQGSAPSVQPAGQNPNG